MYKICISRSDGSSLGADFEVPVSCEDNANHLKISEKKFSKRFSKCAYWGFFESKKKKPRNNIKR